MPAVEKEAPFLRIEAPAKLNLCLKVTGRRPDGYHELVSVMVPIDIVDIVEVEVGPREITLTCDGLQVPEDENNLAYRAALSFLRETGIQEGLHIRLTKNIPVAAGMGGGSSDAAATLLALNEMWSKSLPPSRLHALAAELGADVPFFLYRRPSVATGIGEVLEPLSKWPKLWYVVVSPPFQVSTPWVYGNLKLKLTTGKYDYIVQTLKYGQFSVARILENDLEEVTTDRFPIINHIKRLLLEAGAEGALMSGSGPSVFGLFPSLSTAVLAKQHLISQNLGDVFVATNWERGSAGPSERIKVGG